MSRNFSATVFDFGPPFALDLYCSSPANCFSATCTAPPASSAVPAAAADNFANASFADMVSSLNKLQKTNGAAILRTFNFLYAQMIRGMVKAQTI